MKNYTKKSLKASNGITLIALVITIIVLLILAGISISMLSGDNGILQKATDAKTKSDEAQIRERIRLAYNSALAKDITNKNGEVQKSTLEDELENEFPNKTIGIADSSDKKEWVITIDGVTENVPIGKDTPTALKVAEHKNEKFDTNTELEDNFGNKITVPEGFKITSDSPDNVTGGIVIEDVDSTRTTVGSQFVWIPVGDVYTNEAQTELKTIVLDRYVFEDDTFTKTGTPTSLSQEFTNTEGYHYWVKNNYEEETIARINQAGKNATAKNISSFLQGGNVEKSKGFYIGRYEARVEGYSSFSTSNSQSLESWTGYTGGTLVEKKDAQVYNYITQNKAAELSRAMYSNLGEFESDLINSYAWDTATLFLQKFGEVNYSIKSSINSSLENTGTTTDHPCNVYDMASNCLEWTTETSKSNDGNPCVFHGGGFYSSSTTTAYRGYTQATNQGDVISFRPVLYLK